MAERIVITKDGITTDVPPNELDYFLRLGYTVVEKDLKEKGKDKGGAKVTKVTEESEGDK